MTCSLILISCGNGKNSLTFDNAIKLKIPEEFKYDPDLDTYNLDNCSISVSYDSIVQKDETLPKNNFYNTMNVIEPGKKLLHEEIIENDGLEVGVKEVLDKQNYITHLIFTEVQDHLLLIKCRYENSDKEIFKPKVQMIISSVSPND